MSRITVYISIGNSDDKLTQRQWSLFISEIQGFIDDYAEEIHGVWFSEPASAFQNACWCVEFDMEDTNVPELHEALKEIAGDFGQSAIAWAQTNATEMITP